MTTTTLNLIKVCGMRHPVNINALVQLPINWMGLIFYEKSKRNVPNSAAKEIVEASAGKVSRVGVFVNEDITIVLQKVARFKLEYVQLHGSESADYCYDLLTKSAQTFGCADNLKIIKAFSVDEAFDFSITQTYTPYVHYFLFDTKGENPGGNGFTFDWSLLNKYTGTIPFLLSGGIDATAANTILNLDFPRLVGVDLNSKFEVEPALKDIDKIKKFVQILRKEQVA